MLSNHSVARRSLLLGTLASTLVPWSVANSQQAEELQAGDPDEPKSLLVVDQAAIGELYRIVAFNIMKDAAGVAAKTLSIAEGFVGKNQTQNPEMVEEFFGIFGMPARTESGKFLPFCAAGLSYCAARAYCDYDIPRAIKYTDNNRQMIIQEAISDINRFYFRAHPHVGIIGENSRSRGTWLPKDDASRNDVKPGYLVIFDWNRNRNGRGDHIGLVTAKTGDSVETIEFNTRPTGNSSTGGHVLRKNRDIDYVVGFVKTY